MRTVRVVWVVTAVLVVVTAVFIGAEGKPAKETKASLTKKLWPRERVVAARKAVQRQRDRGLLSEAAYRKRKEMLEGRMAGTYVSQSLSVTDPPLNFVQNGSFEKVNRNSARNRSRWLWWGGWSWGGDYENYWESRPEYVHSGKYSARIRCTGKKGRIGIMTPGLPVVGGKSEYELTFWARGDGDNMLFVNFEAGGRGVLREKIGAAWKQYTLIGKTSGEAKTYRVFFYHIGEGTIWLDDVAIVPAKGGEK